MPELRAAVPKARSRGTSRGPIFLAALLALSACNAEPQRQGESAAAAGGSAAPSGSGSAVASAGTGLVTNSPLSVAVRSKEEIVLSALDGGIWVMDVSGRHAASAASETLQSQPAPSGLPEDLERMQYAGGRLPSSIWLSAARKPEEGKKKGKTPFYRLTGNKLREIADDWQPLVLGWSKKRVLSMSTSSGTLKVKVLEPLTKKPIDEQPSAKVGDPECAKSLKLVQAAAFADGAVVATGRCAVGPDKKSSFVALSWPAYVKQDAPKPPDPPVEPPNPDAPEPEPVGDVGVPMKLVVLGADQAESSKLRSRGLALLPPTSAEIVGGFEGSSEARLFDLAAPTAALELPKLQGSVVGYVRLKDGERWIATDNSLYRQPVGGAWAAVELPGPLKIVAIAGAGATLWVSALEGTTGLLLVHGKAEAVEW